MLKSGIVSITLKGKSIDEVISLAVKAKLAGIEWSENHHIRPGDLTAAAVVRKKTETAGLEVASYGSYCRAGIGNDFEKSFCQSLATARELGAPAIRIWAGDKGSAVVSTQDFTAIAGESCWAAETAAKYGVRVACEWHRNTLTDTNESAMKFYDAAQNNNLYSLWQPSPDMNEAERKEGLTLLKKRLLNIHIYYWKESLRLPLAEGAAFWKEYLRLIDRTEDHFLLLEFVKDDMEEQFLNDAETLNAWINEDENGLLS